MIAKAFGVSALGFVVHLFVDRHVEFAKHSGPVRVFVKLRKPLGELGNAAQYADIAFDNGFEIGPLNLHRNLFTGEKAGTVNLSKRRGRNRLQLKLGINFVDLPAKIFFNSCKRNLIRKRRHIVLQLTKGDDKRQRQEIGARSH